MVTGALAAPETRPILTHSSAIDQPHGDPDRRFSRKGFSPTSPDEIVFLAIWKGLDLSAIRTSDFCTPATRLGFKRLDQKSLIFEHPSIGPKFGPKLSSTGRNSTEQRRVLEAQFSNKNKRARTR
jgi:hypothetical protein